MPKKRKSESSALTEIDRTIYPSFRGAASSLSQFFSQSVNQQKVAFQAGERHGVEKLYEWMIAKERDAAGLTEADVITYLQANAAEHTIGNRLLRYEDYINNISTSLGVSRHESILNRLNELKAEVDKARAVNNKVADLQAALDKAEAISAVSQSEVETLKADKDKALKELEAKEMEVATERSLKEKADATVAAWKPNYDLQTEKMLALFDCVVPHLEVCQAFRADVRPFWAKYEPADLENFDQETTTIAGDAVVQSPLIDKALVSQYDDVVNITAAEYRVRHYRNPDDPADLMITTDYLFLF